MREKIEDWETIVSKWGEMNEKKVRIGREQREKQENMKSTIGQE